MNGRSVSMEVKRDLRNTKIVPTLTYASETWAWNESQRSRVQAVEIIYLGSACGVSRMDGMSTESVYEHGGKEGLRKTLIVPRGPGMKVRGLECRQWK